MPIFHVCNLPAVLAENCCSSHVSPNSLMANTSIRYSCPNSNPSQTKWNHHQTLFSILQKCIIHVDNCNKANNAGPRSYQIFLWICLPLIVRTILSTLLSTSMLLVVTDLEPFLWYWIRNSWSSPPLKPGFHENVRLFRVEFTKVKL